MTGFTPLRLSCGQSSCTEDAGLCDDGDVCTDDLCEEGTCTNTPTQLPGCLACGLSASPGQYFMKALAGGIPSDEVIIGGDNVWVSTSSLIEGYAWQDLHLGGVVNSGNTNLENARIAVVNGRLVTGSAFPGTQIWILNMWDISDSPALDGSQASVSSEIKALVGEGSKLLASLEGGVNLYTVAETGPPSLDHTWSVDGDVVELAFYGQDHVVLIKETEAGGVLELRQIDEAFTLVGEPLELASKRFNDILIKGEIVHLATEEKESGDPAGLERVSLAGLSPTGLGVQAVAPAGASGLSADKETLFVTPVSVSMTVDEPILYAYALADAAVGELTALSTLTIPAALFATTTDLVTGAETLLLHGLRVHEGRAFIPANDGSGRLVAIALGCEGAP